MRTPARSVHRQRVALLYGRNAHPGDYVLDLLETGLRSAGHEVFVDRNARIGPEWAREIEHRMLQYDAVIPFLSRESVQSEMLAAELEAAFEAAQRNAGKPRILPIRVNFEGSLPEPFFSILGNRMCSMWRGTGDDALLLSEVLDSLNGKELPRCIREAEPGGAGGSTFHGPGPDTGPSFYMFEPSEEALAQSAPREAAMPSAPAPAPPPLPAGAPAPPYGRVPGSQIGELFHALTGLFHRKQSAPPEPPRDANKTPAYRSGISRRKPTAPALTSPPAKAAQPIEPVARVPRHIDSGKFGEAPRSHVDFSVYAPARVQPGSSFLLSVWACLPGQRTEMVERATGPSRKVEAGSRGGILVPSATPLLLSLRLDGFGLDNPIEPFAWHGQVTNVSFLVSTPGQLAPGAYPGEVQLLRDGALIAKFYFEVVVAAAQTSDATAPAQQAGLRSEWVRSAFASYASPDREKVVQRVQGITATGVKVYLDVASLHTGHQWQPQLFHAIESSDVFYLFWSRFAKASENVETEWRAALEKKGLAFIHPIPLEDPRHAHPPEELRSLHFNDIYLAILRTSESSEGRE